MTIKWRQHEIILGAVATIGFIVATWLRDSRFNAEMLRTLYEQPFTARQVPFNYWRNIFFPDVMLVVVMFTCQCWLNFFILPGLFRNNHRRRYWMELAGLLVFLFSAAAGSTFLLNELDYRSPILPNRPDWQILSSASRVALNILVPYGIYLFIREWAINRLQKNRRAEYLALVSNKFTLATFLYLTLLTLIILFRFPGNNLFFISFFFILPSVVIGYLFVLYGILVPESKSQPNDNKRWFKILLATFLISIPFTLLYQVTLGSKSQPLLFIVTSIALQWLIAIPAARFSFGREKEQLQRLARLENELNRTHYDLELLRMQIQPHFLFNTLNAIYGTAIQEKAGKTAASIQLLGDIMRFHLQEASTSRIPVGKEFQYIKNYIQLQQLRFPSGTSVRIESNIAEPEEEGFIEPMILLPFIENAFKHGISYTGNSFIKTELRVNNGLLEMRVINSLFRKQAAVSHEPAPGIGLQNARERLQLVYANKHTLSIQTSNDQFIVHLTIKLS